MNKIKNVIFDLGGVLIDWHPHYLFQQHGYSTEQTQKFLTDIDHNNWNLKQDAGRSFDEGVKEALPRYPHYKKEILLYSEGWEQMLGGVFEENIQLMKDLKKSGYRMLALTNWNQDKFKIARRKYEWLNEFEDIVVSGEEKLVKPDPKIYQIIINRNKLVPSETVFIDDNKQNVLGAQALGFHAIQYISHEQLKHDLAQLKVVIHANTKES